MASSTLFKVFTGVRDFMTKGHIAFDPDNCEGEPLKLLAETNVNKEK
jgi:hypothetical protein